MTEAVPLQQPRAPRLILITDCQGFAASEIERRTAWTCQHALPGAVAVQLRDRELPLRDRMALGRSLLATAHDNQQMFLVNDRLDLAVLLGADGVHLAEQSVSCADARSMLEAKGMARPWISRAGHDPQQAPDPGVDAVLLAPIISERKGRKPLGLDGLREARARLPHDVLLFALGGVDANNAASCLAAGAHGIAAIGAAFKADPEELLEALSITR